MPHQIAQTGRILVVTPQPHSCSICALLGEHGYDVVRAADATQAVALAQAQPPDLILLDLPIPGTTAVELLHGLHATAALQAVPIIVLTATPDQTRLLRAFAAGAVDYIGQPYNEEELLARVQVHLRLKLTHDRLEQVARERQALVTLVAHDLKNPLTSVLFACEMLAQPDCRPERAPRYLQIIEDSTREALTYIHDYLDTQANPARAGGAASGGCAHLGETLHWLAARYELQLEAHGLRLRVQPPETEACVAISRQVLRQVGENLISNALKYARAGGELELVARAGAPGYWQVVAQDRGPGVPSFFQPRLFQPFERLRGNGEDPGHSNGLGLALARQIVVNAGGQLWYEDREGGGARFLLELPEARCESRCN
ncbi:MAG: ATP-binding protein [Thermomonas haemolytica]